MNANLTSASFWGADLKGANLVGADLTGLDLGESKMDSVVLRDIGSGIKDTLTMDVVLGHLDSLKVDGLPRIDSLYDLEKSHYSILGYRIYRYRLIRRKD